MQGQSNITAKDQCAYILVTGANTGVGFATCRRLIEDFLRERPEEHSLHVIITTRSEKKSADTIAKLSSHVRDISDRSHISHGLRISLSSQEVDLTSLLAIRSTARRILATYPRLDVLICNAGFAGWTGINWPKAIWLALTDPVHSVTYPSYNIGSLGWTTQPQLPTFAAAGAAQEPPLGEIFCANVFGHYMLAHQLLPLLSKPSGQWGEGGPGRVIWVGSVAAEARAFSISDPQGLETRESYTSSKRLTDILAITANLPSTRKPTSTFFSPSPGEEAIGGGLRPRFYLSHPGVAATELMPLSPLVRLGKLASFYFARFLGSPWHTISPHKGALSAVWLALSPQVVLDGFERANGVGKWGSGTDRWGRNLLLRTFVEGWGYGGLEGDSACDVFNKNLGRMRGTKDVTEKDRKEFEELGGRAWEYMEELRREWEERLAKANA